MKRAGQSGTGWQFWNGRQFGAWIGLGTALFGAAVKITNPIDSWVKGIAGGCCYLIAIFGGATPHTKRTFELGELTVNLNLTHSTTFTLTPVTLHIAGAKSAPTLTSTTWYRVEDGRDVVTLVGQGANGYSSLAVWGPSARGNTTKRNGGSNFVTIGPNNDYAYINMGDGNSAREYYYDHSYADWDEHFNRLAYWVLDGQATQNIQQFCMVPQDSQGNGLAAISVQTNFESGQDQQNCYRAAMQDNPTMQPNR